MWSACSLRVLCVAIIFALAAGCPKPRDNALLPAARPFAGQKVRLLVVEDPALAAAARQYQGEWRALTGAEFEVQGVPEHSLDKLLAAADLPCDAVIYPAYQLGCLLDGKLLAPAPKDLLNDVQFDALDVFETLRLREATADGTVYGISFGSPVFTCLYRADLFERFDKRPPQTWDEYRQLAEFFSDADMLGEAATPPDSSGDWQWCGALEPLAPGWAGLMLLARAAPYAKHADYFSTLFDMDTMAPRIAAPPFVRALEELVAARQFGPGEMPFYDPAGVRTAFARGQCALAITWPSGARNNDSSKATAARSRVAVAFAQLPGSRDVYHPQEKKWIVRETLGRVPLITISGRLGSVTKQAAHPAASFHLLASLAGPQWSEQVAAASPHVTLFRETHLKSPRPWVSMEIDLSAARNYAEVLSDTFANRDALSALSIPGRADYLAALDQAVHAAVTGKTPPAEALQTCTTQWQAITQRLGLNRQQEAYRRSVLVQP